MLHSCLHIGLTGSPFLPFLLCIVFVTKVLCVYSTVVIKSFILPIKHDKSMIMHMQKLQFGNLSSWFCLTAIRVFQCFPHLNKGTFKARARVINRTSVFWPSPKICVEQNLSRAAVITSSFITQWNILCYWLGFAAILETPSINIKQREICAGLPHSDLCLLAK